MGRALIIGNVQNIYTDDDKNKLSTVEEGAQINTITGIKGESESEYRTGDINITKSNIGLGNVEDKSSETIRAELTTGNVTDALGYIPENAIDITYEEFLKLSEAERNNGITYYIKDGSIFGTTPPVHITNSITDAAGIHGIRYRNGILQIFNSESNSWVDIISATVITDDILSDTSENAIQNKAVTAKINEVTKSIAELVDGTTVVSKATSAESATNDSNGNDISKTYVTKDVATNYVTKTEAGMTYATKEELETKSATKIIVLETVIPVDGFTSTTAPYKQTIALDDILETDNPIIALVPNVNNQTHMLQRISWGMISKIETTTNGLIVTCYNKKPTTDVPITIQIIRTS